MESQLHDKDMQKYLIEREVWTENQFDEIDWTSYETAFKRMGRSRQTSIAKVCHNMWHTGVKHILLYYHEPHPCCMCGEEKDDWRHIMTCRSLDASFHRAEITGCIIAQRRLMGKGEERNGYLSDPKQLWDHCKKILKILHRTPTTTS
jgi:hypothetical protein